MGEIWQATTKHNKRLPNKANGHKVFQMFIKEMKNSNSKALQNIPKLEDLV
jgi:hypothetical protein